MPLAFNLAAIDAGSNAIRLVIARANPRSKTREGLLRVLETERYALRLGGRVFLDHRFERDTIEKAVHAFRHFRSLMDLHDVKDYRAVATSATREARNQREFLDRIFDASGIRLEVIEGSEEARLVRRAVSAALEGRVSPRIIADLGGGSLEINLMKGTRLESSAALPIGTVRLMESFGVKDSISSEQLTLIRGYVQSLLRRFFRNHSEAANPLTVVSGGNAEALALISPGISVHGIPTIDLTSLRRKLPLITSMKVKERMKAFRVRKDRAEVMGIAATVLETVARWWNIEKLIVPGVGVKEGILADYLDAATVGSDNLHVAGKEELALSSARRFAMRMGGDEKHAAKVSTLALSLFDQLQRVHKLGSQERMALELAAILHDAGHAIHSRLHHRHGEYLVRHGDIPGIEPNQRAMVACLIRFHSEPDPSSDDKLFSRLPRKEQLQIRSLVSIFKIADALDCDHRQGVSGVEVELKPKKVIFTLHSNYDPQLILWTANKKAVLFETVFGRSAEFHRAG